MKSIVIHSGGMDSSLCLALAKRECTHVESLSFDYGQRHREELVAAAKICRDWNVPHTIIRLDFLPLITRSALLDPSQSIEHIEGQPANTFVMGRNGLLARLGAIFAHKQGAKVLYMGIIESENSGYPDCTRHYMDLQQQLLRLDLQDPTFEIRTPLVAMTKQETMVLAKSLGLFDYLVKETISCYEGLRHPGCQKCPACLLRNEALAANANTTKA